jgi:hypothetical protein
MKNKSLRVTYWIITVLFALFMLFSGVSELVGTEQGNALFDNLGYPLYLSFILGVAKILGSIAIVQNKWGTIREWAYAGFTFDLIGASLSFAFIGAGFIDSFMPLIFLMVMFVSYGLWKKLY